MVAAVKPPLPRDTHRCTRTPLEWRRARGWSPVKGKKVETQMPGKLKVSCLVKQAQSYDINRRKASISCYCVLLDSVGRGKADRDDLAEMKCAEDMCSAARC